MSLFGYVSCPRCNGQGHEADDSEVDCLACRGDGFTPDPTDEDDQSPTTPPSELAVAVTAMSSN